MKSFIHLHNHTHYSLLDGLTQLDELVEYAKEDGAPAVAITDHGVMYGVLEFYQKCKKAGIKPIIGVEAYLAPGSRTDKSSKSDERNYHLLLLAKNETGYKNLIKLTSLAHLQGYYYKPRIDWEILQEHHEGVIACSACMGGEIPNLILSGKLDRARQRILEYDALFGRDNFYLELQSHPELEGQETINRHLIEFSRELGVPLVATNDLHYLRPDDYEAQDVLLCLQTKRKKDERDRMAMHGRDYYYKTAKEMYEAFADVPEACENTLKIAEMCNLEIELGHIQLPYFALPEGVTGDAYLRLKCEEGLMKRYGRGYEDIDQIIKERMDYELSVVSKMGWPAYFLIVADFVNWAKSNNIVVGPGRGSAAGSLICFLTGITNLDPLRYDLLFERFLNPDRISMPDIDMDFADTRRDEVLRYVSDKYGEDHVSQIITFGTMAARAAIRDVGRVLDYPYDYCDRLAKMIPMFSKIRQAIDTVAELKDVYKTEEGARKILDFAQRLEGVARHASTHACGVLITKNPLTDHVPIQYASSSDRSIVSQYSLHPIEDLGLLKMDFLGLKNLTIIESAIKIIKNTRGIDIDIENIPLEDKKAYELFQQGETTGVFQFESSGMKRYLRELKPTEFEDIIAMVALYRPGPMEWIPDYISGKHGKKKPEYLHPKLKPILSKTYGVAIYQEQVMQMARDLAGFTMAEADVLRKAVGKKIAKLLGEQKIKFIEGCVKNGIPSQLAETIFSFIEPFAGYGFNRSHAACYALIAYQTAYLKSHWPTEFMAALLTADQGDIERIAVLIEECRHMGIEVSQPNINQSFGSFTVVTSGTAENRVVGAEEKVTRIRFGLKAIKNVGEHIADVLIAERKQNGPFLDVTDLLERINDRDLNKKSLESMIKSGGLDDMGERGQLLGNMENILNYSKEITKNRLSNQASLFGDGPDASYGNKLKLAPGKNADRQEMLSWEKELLGVYITEHPFADYKKQFANISLINLVDLPRHIGEEQVSVAGIISSVKKIITRSNDSMLFVKIEDAVTSIEILVFPSLLKTTADVWVEGKAVMAMGKLSEKEQEMKLLANAAVQLDLNDIAGGIDRFKKARSEAKIGGRGNGRYNVSGYPANSKKEVSASRIAPIERDKSNHLKIVISSDCGQEDMAKLRDLLLMFPGDDKVYMKLLDPAGEGRILETGFKVSNNEELRHGILENIKGKIVIKD